MFDEELDRFKRLDLRQIAATLGFVIDKRESSRNSTVMRNGDEKIIISLKPDGHFTYWSPHDDKDHGTVIDLMQRRLGQNIGQVRQCFPPNEASPRASLGKQSTRGPNSRISTCAGCSSPPPLH